MPTDPREHVVRRLFELERISRTLGDQAEAIIRDLYDDIVAQLARLDPTAVIPRYQQGRLDKLAEQVQALTGDAYDRLYKEQRDLLARVGARQVDTATAELRAIIGAGSRGKLAPTTGLGVNFFKALVDEDPIEGALLKDWFKGPGGQADRTRFRVTKAIRQGMTEGETIGDIIRRVRGRSDGRGGFVGGAMQTSTREAEAIVRTSVNHLSNAARRNTDLANADILKGYTIVVTFDSRTSDICIDYGMTPDRVYDLETGPRPPFHVNCRTTTAPEVDWEGLGIEPPPEGTRATADGQMSADATYEDWLRNADPSVQEDVLGPTRAKLFREERMSLKEMLTSDGRRIPLEELGVGRGAGALSRYADAVDGFVDLPEAVVGQVDAGIAAVFDEVEGLPRMGRLAVQELDGGTVAEFLDDPNGEGWVMRFHPEYLADAVGNRAASQRQFLARRDKFLASLEAGDLDDLPETVIAQNLERVRTTTRFSVAGTSDNPIFSTAAHEAGHAIMRMPGRGGALVGDWRMVLERRAITPKMRWQISEYAATDVEELWAEIVALVAEGRRSELPTELAGAYNDMLNIIREFL